MGRQGSLTRSWLLQMIAVLLVNKTTRSISIKVGIKHLWVKGFQISSNKGPGPFQNKDNCR